MELKFDFNSNRFAESHGAYKDDFDVEIDAIISYYKRTKPRTIRIKIGGNNPDKFLEKITHTEPRILFYNEASWIYFPIERIKDKII